MPLSGRPCTESLHSDGEQRLDYSTFIDPFEPCPKELRPYAAFAIGYLVPEIRRHQVALWRKPRHRDGILSDCGFVQDGIKRALHLLSEEIHGAVTVYFYQQLGKVRNDSTLLNRLVSNSSSENYRLSAEYLEEATGSRCCHSPSGFLLTRRCITMPRWE